MGNRGFILLGLLLILSALCRSGHSLQCYNCRNIIGSCTTTTNCSHNFDACLFVQADARRYYHCWKFDDCNYNYISKALEERKLSYDCCKKNLCNKSDGTSISGKTILLATQLLAVCWHIFL